MKEKTWRLVEGKMSHWAGIITLSQSITNSYQNIKEHYMESKKNPKERLHFASLLYLPV